MKQITKKRWITVGAVLTVTAPITVGTFLVSNQNNGQFVFDGRIFNNEQQALHYLMQYHKAKTKEVTVVGDVAKSYANAETGLLNKSLLPTFDSKDFSFYYHNAGGGINTNYDIAKNTYYNKGRVRTMYIDGFGNAFLSEAQAKRSMENYKMHQMIPYYTVDYYNKTSSYQKNINPFNREDIRDFQTNIKDNINDIIVDNLKEKNPTYQVKVLSQHDENNQKINYDQTFQLDWMRFFWEIKKNYNYSDFEFDESINNIHLNIFKANKSVKSKLYSDWSPIGTLKWNDSRTANFNQDYQDDKNKLEYTIRNYDTLFQWNGLVTTNSYTKQEFEKLVKGGYDPFIKHGGSDKQISGDINTNDSENEYKTFMLKLKSVLKDENSLEYLRAVIGNDSNISKLLNNNILREIILQNIQNQIINKLDIASPLNGVTEYWLQSLPKFKILRKSSGVFRITNDIKVKDENYLFKYKTNVLYNFNFNKVSSEINIKNINKINPELLSVLLNARGDIKLQIIKNGLPLFDAAVNVDQKNGDIKATWIHISEANHASNEGKIVFAKKDANGNPTYYQYYLNLYNQLYMNRKLAGISLKYAYGKDIMKVFKKYFEEDVKEGKAPNDPDWLYREILRKNDLKIWSHQIFRVFLTTIFDAYNKYKDNGNYEIFKMIARKLPYPDSILMYGRKDNQSGLTISPFLTKYILKTINGFNTKISSGAYSSIDKNNSSSYALATTLDNWNNLINRPTKDLPAQILVAYDNNGQQINVGNYLHDNESIMEFNIKLRLDPRRDYDHLSYQLKDEVKNEINKIYELDFKNSKLYFDIYDSLKKYLLKYIREHSYQL